MAKKKKYDSEDGVWRTVGGRRIFIRKGQDLSSAMRESGKFNNSSNKTFERKYDSVEDRYNKDEDFRDMLKEEHEKTLKATRGEINSYFDLEDRDKEIGSKDDLYKMINDNYYNVGKEDFDKIYSEEATARYNKVDKEWQELSKKMEKDYNEFGTTNWKDEKKLNELSAKRDRLSIYNDEVEKQKTGNDYLPKETKVEVAGKSNRKEVSDNIQSHILSHYENPVDFMEQMDAMDYLPTRWHAGEELAKGGSYLIYTDDQRKFLDGLNINPKGKTFGDDKVSSMYNSLVGRESEHLYNRLEKLFEQYKKEHKNSNATLDDFRKWFK